MTKQIWTPQTMGRKGGQSRSAAKVAAVRENGKKGGRPPATDWEPAGSIVGNCPTCAERYQGYHVECSFHVEKRGANRRYTCEACGTVTRRKPRAA